jgi:serpin B
LYQWWENDNAIIIKQDKPQINKQAFLIKSLDQDSFLKINKLIDRDSLDLMMFNKLKKPRSTLYSSLSLREALLYCYLGSSIDSKCWNMYNEIFSGIKDDLMLSFHRDLNKYLLSTGKLKIANSIWYDNSAMQLHPAYKQKILTIGECQSPITQYEINDWVAIKTDGMITSINVPTNIKLIILNVLYFNDRWKKKFDRNESYESRFVSWDDHESIVKMMYQNNDFKYTEDATAQAILLDYDSPFSLLVILPKDGTEPIPSSHDDIRNIIASMSETKVEVHLPKFSFEDTHTLVEPLFDVGYVYVKDDDYNRMILNNPSSVYIEQIIQKTKIDVDEDGTLSPSESLSIHSINCATDKKKPTIFKADHSFLFYVIHRPTIELLLSGIFNSL